MPSVSYPITAFYLGKALNLAEVEKGHGLAVTARRRNSLLFQLAMDRLAVVFSYGVAVLFNFDGAESHRYLQELKECCQGTARKTKTEEYTVVIDPDQKPEVEFNNVILNRLDPDKIHVVAEVLAQSVAIEYVEERVVEFVGRFEKIHAELEKSGRIRVSDREVQETIGAGRNVVQYVISKLSLLDKPDATWEDKEMEALFVGMRKMFELDDRFQALQFRLNFINDSSEMILEILQDRRSTRLSWGVAWLIAAFCVLELAMWHFRR